VRPGRLRARRYRLERYSVGVGVVVGGIIIGHGMSLAINLGPALSPALFSVDPLLEAPDALALFVA